MKKRKKRKELDYKTRLAIAKYLNDGLNIIQISKILGRDDAVLYREVNKRSVDGVYNPLLAEEDAIKSRSISDGRRLNDETKAYIEEKLSLKWSPRQIASQIEKDTGHYISYPTIYRYIRNGLVKVDVKRDMRQAGKKYNKSSEKRGKLDVGSRVIKYRLKKY
ncbi:TPA: helix-turn-helix domain-containing protein [Staphylococcus aureus]|nr:helix-turn-helix domain-containing protein [Staphylococcus aureus]